MTDSHAHLFAKEIIQRIEEHIKEFKNAGGNHILNVAIDSESIVTVIEQSIRFQNSYPGLILTGLGIHPEAISKSKEKNNKEIEFLKDNLGTHKERIIAIGECGLDYFHISKQAELDDIDREIIVENQKEILREQVILALDYNLPLSIHTRDNSQQSNSTLDAIKILTIHGKGKAKGVFHSYTGSIEALKEILNLGYYIGFNGIITYPKAENIRQLLKEVPLDRILLETDCPYLPPQLARSGKRTAAKYGKPLDIEEIAEKVAIIKEVSLQEIIEITGNNFKELFLSN